MPHIAVFLLIYLLRKIDRLKPIHGGQGEGETRDKETRHDNSPAISLSPYLLVSLSRKGAAKSLGDATRLLRAANMCGCCSPRPTCAHPSPGGFAGALAGGGAPG